MRRWLRADMMHAMSRVNDRRFDRTGRVTLAQTKAGPRPNEAFSYPRTSRGTSRRFSSGV